MLPELNKLKITDIKHDEFQLFNEIDKYTFDKNIWEYSILSSHNSYIE